MYCGQLESLQLFGSVLSYTSLPQVSYGGNGTLDTSH